jgi:hypothetical protein
MKRQLDQNKAYLSIALEEGHGVSVVLFVLPDGKLGAAKLSVDTRGDKRSH